MEGRASFVFRLAMNQQVEFAILWVLMLLVVSWGSYVVWERRHELSVSAMITLFVLLASTVIIFLHLGGNNG